MSTSIDNAFIKLFDNEVFVAYQREGSQLRGTIREKMGTGNQFRFQKYGTGSIGIKGKHGDVPVMNADHSYVELTIQDYHGGEFINDLDELKTNIDERQLAASALAKAAGRKVDDIIVAAMNLSVPGGQAISKDTGGADTGMNRAKALELFKRFSINEVPDDGGRYCALSPTAFTDMFTITEFASQDYIGPDALPWKTGVTAKRWMGIMWMQFTGLPPVASTTRPNLAWHRGAVALGMNTEMKTNFDWVPTKAEYFAQVRITAGSIRIEDNGVWQLNTKE